MRKLEEYVSRRSLVAFIAVSFLIIVSVAIINTSQASQKIMFEVFNITYDQRTLLNEVNDKIIFLLKNSKEGTSEIFIKNTLKDISKIIKELKKNQQLLKKSQNQEGKIINFFLLKIYPKEQQSKLITQIDKNLQDMSEKVEKLIQTDPVVIKSEFNFWKPSYLTIIKNGKYAKHMSELHEEVYEAAINHNNNLSRLQLYLLVVVISGIWLIWAYVLKPLANHVNYQFNIIKENQKKLHHQTHFDALTKVMNRQSFSNITKKTNQTPSSLSPFTACIIIDIDEFKLINDSFGHPIGDLVLKEIASRLKRKTTASEQVFRIGGDEFAIIVYGVNNIEEINKRVKQLSELCSQPIDTGSIEIPIHVSIGVAYQAQAKNTLQELFAAADIMLYQVKESGGKGYEFYSVNDQIKITDLLKMDTDLESALKNSQIEIYYQPIFQINQNKITGLEALARWNHPEKGILPASHWLITSKRLGFLSEVSMFALKQIEADIEKWSEMDIHPIQISINTTEKLLVSGLMFEHLNQTIKRFNQHNKFSIGIEIPESIILDRNFHLITDQLIAMREEGFKILLDDFGTGYATLSHLVSLPFDSIKVDRQFCKNVSNSHSHRSIIKTLQVLADDLGKSLICEGVEDEKSLRILSELGCEYVQGYYYSKAISFDKTTELLKKSILRQT